jgi:hypothetical protein
MNNKIKQGKTMSLVGNTKSAINIAIPGMMPFIQRVIDPFLTTNPYWGLAIYAVIGLYGVYLALRQDELNELIIFIQKHPEEFREEIVKSEEFRKGFIQFFDTYVKERLDNKRKILREILLSFAKVENKEEYELERLQDTVLRISPEAIELLAFIKKEILPKLRKNVESEILVMKYLPEDRERLLDTIWARQSVSEAIMNWIGENYNPNSQKVKKQYNIGSEHNETLSVRIWGIEHKVTKEKTEAWPELLGLGIFRITVTGGTIGSGSGSSYHLTDFGFRFMDYISEE